jgi:hypothetical protein
VSKSTVNSDAGIQVQVGEPMAPSQVPCLKEAAEDDAYNMDFVNNNDILADGKTPDAMPQETLNGSPTPAATVLPAIPTSVPKDTLRKNPRLPSTRSNVVHSDVDNAVQNQDASREEPISINMACVAGALVDKRTQDQAQVPNVKEVDPRKGTDDQDLVRAEGASSDWAVLEAANKLLAASKMRVDSLLRAAARLQRHRRNSVNRRHQR